MQGSTYRLQLRGETTLDAAAGLVPYLRALGVGALYASPILQARSGSTHGYDVADPTRIDRVLGGERAFEHLARALAEHDMGLLLDIVPNHMAASTENPWWRDLLENGRASRFAGFFDVEWDADPAGRGRLVLPILGRPYAEALEAGELVPRRNAHGLVVCYYERELPLEPSTWAAVLPELALPDGERHAAVAELRRRLAALPDDVVEPALRRLAGTAGDPASFDALDDLLERQCWRLTYWRAGLSMLNYRRFFDISDLVALRAEDPGVFEASHDRILELYHQGKVTGLRIDHVDGLLDPRLYLRHLRERGVRWVVVEKILVGAETLREDWDVDGTTGYEHAAAATVALVDPDGFWRLEALHAAHHPGLGFEGKLAELKRAILDDLFEADSRAIVRHLRRIAARDRYARDLAPNDLAAALRELTVALPVYRTYVGRDGPAPEDAALLERALAEARRDAEPGVERALDFLERVLWMADPAEGWLAFVSRWQQLTGPAMAKGMEDTALYVHNRLVAVNEVGNHPVVPADPVAAFHALQEERLRQGPGTLSVLSTHDTKRSADVRARIAVLSEVAETWADLEDRWCRELGGDPEEVALLLQCTLGIWPFDGRPDRERLAAYVVKAAREAKRHTSWHDPDEAHEQRLVERVDALLAGIDDELVAMHRKVAFHGALNALSQVALQLASPGVADVYQGDELFSFSLVDPDNRRPVDWALRRGLLEDLKSGFDPPELRERWQDGRLKLLLYWKGLELRRAEPELLQGGAYLPLGTTGPLRAHTIALARRLEGRWLLAVAPRLTTRLGDGWPLGEVWGDEALPLPPDAPHRWRCVLTGRTVETGDAVPVGTLLSDLPVALWQSDR